MEPRLTTLDKCAAPQYAQGSLLLLEACALHLDNVSKQCIAQLKWKNIGSKTISALLIELKCFDVFGHEVKKHQYQYDRLSAGKGKSFGGKEAIVLESDKVSRYEVYLKAVCFEDGKVREYDSPVAYTQLPEAVPHGLTDDMLEQYERDLRQQNKNISVKNDIQATAGLWQCVCGSWQEEDDACLECHAKKEKLIAAASPELVGDHLAEYSKQQEIARKDAIYTSAKRNMEEHNEDSYENAIKQLESIPGWKDADALILVCQQKIAAFLEQKETERLAQAREAEQRRIKQQEAARRMKKWGIILSVLACIAVAVFMLVTKVIIPNQKYDAAMGLMAAGKYEEALASFSEIEAHKDSSEKIEGLQLAIKHGEYDAAMALLNAGKYLEAYEAFVSLNGHKDSTVQATFAYKQYKVSELKTANVGSYITFGSYEQDTNLNNGKEDIEWLVLANETNRMLVISRYALDSKAYNNMFTTDVTWENSTLRKWLNTDFLNVAFSSAEQAMLPTVTVSADTNPAYNTKAGKDAQDKVFLLSIIEANKYFDSNSTRQCKPTAYAVKQNARTQNSYCLWKLRSPGSRRGLTAHVCADGTIDAYGDDVDFDYVAVRPALWISLEP